MKIVAAFLAASFLLTGCFTKGNLARVTTSQTFQKGRPMRVLVLPFTVDGNPDEHYNNSYTELLSASLMESGMTPVDPDAAVMKAGLNGIPIESMFTGDALARLSSAVNADALLQGSISYEYIPPTSSTSPATMERYRNDSTKRSSVVVKGESSYATGAYYAERAVSLRLVDARSGDILVSAYLNDADLGGYLNSDPKYHPIDELAAALKKNLK